MNFDAMGNYYGGYMEEPDTEANVKPVTQTITTDPKTGEQTMTIKGRPQDLSASNPKTPTVVPPQDDTYRRMIQAESGGRDYTTSGAPLTSPKGAMFSAQVMPSTAANPGYGIRPAQAQTPEEYNRVGQEYYNAMLKKFGTPEAAAAAYNAGPGRVSSNMAANNGQLNVAQLPTETQNYLKQVQPGAPIAPVAPVAPVTMAQNRPQPSMLQRTLGAVADAVIPSAQAAPVPTQPVAPVKPIAPVSAAPAAVPAPTAAPAAVTPTAETLPSLKQEPYIEEFFKNQGDPEYMARLRYDKNAPDWMRSMASNQEYNNLTLTKKQEQAKRNFQQAMESGDYRKVARDLNDRSEEGSYLKMLLLGFISPDLAGREADKLGLTATWQPSQLGDDQVAAKFRRDGTALEGRYISGPKAGQELTADELKLIYGQSAGAAGNKPEYVGGSVVNDKTGAIGRIVSRNGRTMIESGGQLFAPTTQWRQNTVGTDLKLAANKALIDIEGKSTGEQLSWIKKWNAEHPDARIPEDVNGINILRQWAGTGAPAATTTPAPAGGAVAPTAPAGGAVAPTAPAGGAVAPTPGANPTVEKAKEIGRTKIVEKAADVVANEANIITSLEKAKDNIKILESGKTNFGTIISGMIPGERAVGEFFKTEDAIRTKTVMDYINTIAAGNAKSLGANPTDRDLIFVTTNIPNETWSDKDVADWIRKSEKAQRRSLEIARKQVESGGRYQPEVPAETPGAGSSGIKIIKREKI